MSVVVRRPGVLSSKRGIVRVAVHGRTVGMIAVRLARMGEVGNRASVRRGGVVPVGPVAARVVGGTAIAMVSVRVPAVSLASVRVAVVSRGAIRTMGVVRISLLVLVGEEAGVVGIVWIVMGVMGMRIL